MPVSEHGSCTECILDTTQKLYWCNSAPEGEAKCRYLPKTGSIPGPDDKSGEGCRPDSTTCPGSDEDDDSQCKCRHCYLLNSLDKHASNYNCGPYPPFSSPVNPLPSAPYSEETPPAGTIISPTSNKNNSSNKFSILDWVILSILTITILILLYLYITFRWAR